jgi:glutaredoxin 3
MDLEQQFCFSYPIIIYSVFKMAKNVILYTSPICFHCEKAKKFFNENNVKFKEIDIFEDKNAAKEMIEKSGQKRVPVIEIDGEVYSGFDKKVIEEALK